MKFLLFCVAIGFSAAAMAADGPLDRVCGPDDETTVQLNVIVDNTGSLWVNTVGLGGGGCSQGNGTVLGKGRLSL